MATTKKKRSTVAAPRERSFVRSSSSAPFFTFRITQESVYWFILSLLVLALGVWVITLSVKVQAIYDEIDHTNNTPAYIQSTHKNG